MGFDEDLDDAVKQALREMIELIGELRASAHRTPIRSARSPRSARDADGRRAQGHPLCPRESPPAGPFLGDE